ncbi:MULTISPECIES: VOC family protein [Pseudomonas aeruginosa group]|uniref:Glyoxalase-like domain protein n=1 Tax=Pseudomonas paraeruginosa TaxID=2994495 RepID=A0A2R3J117_9PSED|nr:MULTISPECIES: VOC family protein [Pseudomonas aeruginosa group]AVK07859.1 glyoxalase-like domain protein [Pseudomonas paraeruginosa]AWE91133.1 glyoxalase-like domain protein [Pseudomonas paraeruginosa]UYT22641.1 glyoxalase/bleomycin resistance protein/dioxygenase [Pseudomonas aeruginosa]
MRGWALDEHEGEARGNGISLVTLGAADLARSSRCYQALGWQASADGNEQVVFLKGRNLALGLHGRQALAEDARVEDRPTGFAPSPWPATAPRGKKSDRLLFAAALAGGGQATKVPQEVFWGGYSEYVADPDGHLWEVAHKPF